MKTTRDDVLECLDTVDSLFDLALSLLSDVLGERPSKKQIYHGQIKAYPHHQAFKREFVAGWDIGSRFEIDSDTIASWLRKRGEEV